MTPRVKPITTHRGTPVMKPVVSAPVSRNVATERAYQQLVTSQNIYPEWANRLLGRTK